jgi:O-antigen/teichoic acid export membrane protein
MLVAQIKKALSNQFLRNIGWLGIAELANRVFRLGATVTLARIFSPEDYGLMAIVYTVNEFATLIPQRGGIGLKIIQAEDKNLEKICDTAYWLNWIVAIAVFAIQGFGALIFALVSGDDRLLYPLALAGLSYFVFPFSIVNLSLLDRENNLKVSAIANALQSLVGNLVIVVLALMGLGVWAIVWSILFTAPIWMILGWKNHPWRPPKYITMQGWQEIFHFSKNIVGVELLNKLRMNIDYLIVGKFLGISALGTYYFAFNAGSGITLNLVNSVTGAVFPHLCSSRGNKYLLQKNYLSSIKTIWATIVPMVILQSALAPVYVPIVFSNKWESAIPIVMMICTSVIPFAFSLVTLLLLNAIDRTELTLRIDFIFTIVFALAIGIVVMVSRDIFWVAATVAIANWLILPATSVWATRYVFRSRK